MGYPPRSGWGPDAGGADRDPLRLLGRPAAKRHWWLVANDGEVDLCLTDPGRDVDLHVHSDVRSLVDVWMGHIAIGDALRAGDIALDGPRTLVRAFPQWLRLNVFAEHARPA